MKKKKRHNALEENLKGSPIRQPYLMPFDDTAKGSDRV